MSSSSTGSTTRRAAQTGPMSLTELAAAQLAAAHQASSGRSSRTVHGGSDHALRQTLLALVAGQLLHDHESPGDATLQVLQGRVRLATAHTAWDGAAGDHLAIPPERHNLTALEDAVVLLTVVAAAR